MFPNLRASQDVWPCVHRRLNVSSHDNTWDIRWLNENADGGFVIRRRQREWEYPGFLCQSSYSLWYLRVNASKIDTFRDAMWYLKENHLFLMFCFHAATICESSVFSPFFTEPKQFILNLIASWPGLPIPLISSPVTIHLDMCQTQAHYR